VMIIPMTDTMYQIVNPAEPLRPFGEAQGAGVAVRISKFLNEWYTSPDCGMHVNMSEPLYYQDGKFVYLIFDGSIVARLHSQLDAALATAYLNE